MTIWKTILEPESFSLELKISTSLKLKIVESPLISLSGVVAAVKLTRPYAKNFAELQTF